MKTMKKQMRAGLIFVILAGVFFACGNKQPTSDTRTGKGITIRVLTRMSGEDSGTPILEDVIRIFKQKYPDITIQNASVNDSNAFTQQFMTDNASGNTADIIQWAGVSILKEYAETGTFLDLTDLINSSPDIKNNVDPSILNLANLEGIGVKGIYALPIGMPMEVFYYNKDLFAKAGIDAPPKTWDEFYAACDKLLAVDVIPWSLGLANKWRAIHLNNVLMMRMVGTQKAKDLGARKAKWTDSDVVAVFDKIKEMAGRGYFGRDYAGIDYDTEKARFIRGETAMSFDGAWRIATLDQATVARTGTFRMPYFADKPDFYKEDVFYPTQIEIGGQLKNNPDKLQYVWEFLSMFLDKAHQEMYLYEVSNVPLRTDLAVDESRLNPLLAELLRYKKDVTVWGTDAWAYDTLPIMEDAVGDALVGALTNLTAQQAAQQIQLAIEEAER
ncbi:MAG: extracellular solute-binding protein [Treponema sp.]|nr:extracellular solute-binding protein [Treponema sp.]